MSETSQQEARSIVWCLESTETRFRMGLHLRPYWRSLQHSHRPISRLGRAKGDASVFTESGR